MQIILAFILSPLVIAYLAPSAIEGTLTIFSPVYLAISLPIVYIFTLAFALPLFALLPVQHKSKLTTILAASFIAGFGSFALMNLLSMGSYSKVGETVLIENGWLTSDGSINLLMQCLRMGIVSSLAGLLFWSISHRYIKANENSLTSTFDNSQNHDQH